MNDSIDPNLYQEVVKFGARDMEICMQCATCSASCPLSTGDNTFPRKIYRYLQLGLREKLLQSPEPWLCYYCGECNKDCPRGAEPAETMMATRRWLTTQYDWTGLAKRFYLSEAWEIGALSVLSLGIILLFAFFHGPVITDRVSVNTFAPVLWIEIGDLVMAVVLSTFLMSNAFRMFRLIMSDSKIPLTLYITEAKAFILHFLTQKRWRECGEDRNRWLKHFILVTGYLTMMTLIIVFIRWFQVDDSSWHFTSIFGYYATAVLLFITVEMFLSRRKKEEAIHRYSELSDWLFLILLFFTTLTGIIMHVFRIAGWPMGTYVSYVIHLAVAVPMLMIEVPFGKWSHLFYRPLAIFLTTVREKASTESEIKREDVISEIGDTFMSCLQCGTCTSICPWNQVSSFSPRQILRGLAMNSGTTQSVDQAVWSCLTCDACGVSCPRGIDIIHVMTRVRELHINGGRIPDNFKEPVQSLKENGNPWQGDREKRMEWAVDLNIPRFTDEKKYCLFNCCTTAYDSSSSGRVQEAGLAFPRLLEYADVSFGSLGNKENCCGDQAKSIGASELYSELVRRNTEMFMDNNVKNILTVSPHCLNAFKNNYPALSESLKIEHYTVVLDRLIQKGRLIPSQKFNKTVTFHDPCYLGRHNGIYDEPRRILQSIPGIKLVEMINNRESSICCGGGGGGAWTHDPGIRGLGTHRVKEALNTGAEVIATACPYCIRMLNDAVEKQGFENQIVVKDLAELLLESMKMEDETDMTEQVNRGAEQEVCHV